MSFWHPRSLGRLVDLLWPPRCAACDRFVPAAWSFCDGCAEGLVPVPSAGSCPVCAMPSARGTPCRACIQCPPPFTCTRAAVAYGGPVAEAILRFKHGHRRDVGRSLGRWLAPVIRQCVDQDGVDTLIPVPLHPRRLRQRGFNQAVLLARTALRTWPSQGAQLWLDTLRRTRPTSPLGHEPPHERRARLEGAFQVTAASRLTGRRVLLVDDVMTTGATVSACAAELRNAGAHSVQVAVLARAL